ncbi:MAG: type II toxin-antitoxin system CcdA family antitoxin [Nitrososphaeria archaeon]
MSIITVRVSKEIKEKLEKYNINVSETVRKLLEKYVAELEMKDLEERLEQLKVRLKDKIDPKLVAKLVREDREVH